MRFVLTLICLAASSLSACTLASHVASNPPARDAATTTDIADVVVRLYTKAQSGNATIFVKIGTADAPPEFLAAHSTAHVTLKPGSQYQPGPSNTGLQIRLPAWVDDFRVRVTAGRQLGEHMSYGTTYVLVWRWGTWVIESESPAWIT